MAKWTVKWHRSDEGYVTSHCSRFEIWPRFCGTTRPQFYDGYDNQEKCVFGSGDTQSQVKDEVDDWLEKHPLRINAEFL